MRALRGVNLGGWLVLERWMTPSLFKGVDALDEYTFMQTPGALAKLREHQKTFITEKDFAWMSRSGVNAVRIPVGYWILQGDGPLKSSIGRLDWAVRMAKKYDIAVLICMHGAPGSQNGNDHSGRAGAARWYEDAELRTQTVEVLRQLTERYHDEPAVWGIELLNEPLARFWQPVLRKFYKQAYEAIRVVGRPGLVVVYSDAFTPRLFSGALTSKRNFPVVMDHHWYHFFIPRWLQPHVPFKLYVVYLRQKAVLLERLSRAQPIIIGEWSGVLGGEKLRAYPKKVHAAMVNRHIQRQLEAFEHVAGWFYWSYKTEERGVFHFRSLVEDGVITLPVNE